ncbi:phage tail protein [uncultured Oscillibacter sp.]|uniref:phage tail protein n=1 Tax=uncultured Oscillibacter sp. TaxID=876091 RepID=UPI0025E3B19F|nr:phage tail protein [uncultured Oscillibacter sp.]
MEPIQRQMVFCCAEQWLGGLFHGVEPDGDGLRLSGGRRTGVYCTAAVDSGESGFLWRRMAVEAQLPPDTSLRIYAYASDERDWDGRADLDEWLGGLSGDPMPALRELFGPPVSDRCDLCLDRRGRYLWLMLELASAGEASPSVSRLRLWMGGDHMTDYLPAIYQSDDFTHRFLSIFDSMYADMERQIDGLPGRMDYEQADGELLRYLASWVGVEQGETAQALRRSVRTALADYEDRYTVGGVRRSVRELTGRDPIVIEHFQVSANRPDCADPALYRRLYGEDPHRCFVLLPEDTFSSQQERVRFQQSMADRLPAGVSMQLVQLKQCVQLDWHTYLGVNSRVGGYVAAAIDEQVTIHYDTTIGGANHE